MDGNDDDGRETAGQPPVQDTGQDTGLACLMVIANHFGDYISPTQVRHQRGVGDDPFSVTDILEAAKRIKLTGWRVGLSARGLARRTTLGPVVLVLRDGRFGLFLGRDKHGYVLVIPGDPDHDGSTPLSRGQLRKLWTGQALLFKPAGIEAEDGGRFGLRWFRRELGYHPVAVTHILLVSLVTTLLGLVAPLAFQIVINDVIPNHGLATLATVAGALAITYAFNAFLDWIRQYCVSHVAAQLDCVLGSRLYEHMLALPLGYFEARQVGHTVARVRELETVRSFLTGSMLTLPLDLLSIIIILAIMPLYSLALTGWVVGSLVVYALISALATPVLHRRIEEAFSANAQTQSFLVECVSGIATIKSMAGEPQAQRNWEGRLSHYVATNFSLTEFGNKIHQLIRFVHYAVTGIVLVHGANLVIDGALSVGALVAFTMFAGRVAEPVLRLAQVWPDYQRVRVAIQRLADIFEAPAEPVPRHGATMPAQIEGTVRFKACTFQYSPEAQPALEDINLEISAGEVIGIVGTSGSGKSTLAKLIQGLYQPTRGQVFVDGRDIAGLPLGWLRSQIGVVLQENYLFRATIRDNIVSDRGDMDGDTVIAAAKRAGAHEFICDLPGDYGMVLEERGVNLSGGQRQRLAIARALITDPRILIFDEATSALDLESEQIIQANMAEMARGRTMIMIAHRLASLRNATRLITIEKGRIVEDGSHEELLARGGRYAELYALQNNREVA